MVQWLRFCPSDAGHMGSISGQGSVPHAMWHGPPKENKNKQNQQKWIESEEVSAKEAAEHSGKEPALRRAGLRRGKPSQRDRMGMRV